VLQLHEGEDAPTLNGIGALGIGDARAILIDASMGDRLPGKCMNLARADYMMDPVRAVR